MNVYAGVGSRSAPDDVLRLAEAAARRLAGLGWTLRSGHAPGMDQAFERGAQHDAELFLPWPGFEGDVPVWARAIQWRPSARAMEIAESFHPAWRQLKRPARLLHGRNSHVVLGPYCDTVFDSVRFVLCWTPGAEVVGGTGQALRIAAAYRIPVLNLARDWDRGRVEAFAYGDGELLHEEEDREHLGAG